MISDRANILIQNPSSIVTAAIKCSEDPYSADNSKGYLNFGVAQNFLMENEILEHIQQNPIFRTSDIHYNQLNGKENLRVAFSQFAKKYLNTPEINSEINPEHITIQCGVSALCESLAFCLFNPGDSILMAAPYYPGFYYDFTVRFGVKVATVQLKKENDYRHDFHDFKEKIIEVKPKAILLTNPYNPTGEVLSREFQNDIVNYCKEHNIHIIADEIYTLSRLDQKSHYSFLNYDYENIHYLYGVAKDFALAGLRVGFFYTRNQNLSKAMQNVAYFHSVSTQSQNTIEAIFRDDVFLNQYISSYQSKLKASLDYIKVHLPQIQFVTPAGGFFVFINLQKYLKRNDRQGEQELFNILLDQYKINMNPASSMGFEHFGFFRMCYAKQESELQELCRRMRVFLDT